MAAGKVFGRPLDKLLEADRKIRPTLQVPLIVYEAVRCINRYGIDNEGIFRISGNKERVSAYRDAYDKGEHIDFVKDKAVPFDVSSLLKQYLRELPEPILLSSQYEKWIAAHEMNDREAQMKALKTLLDALPPANANVIRLLVPFWARIAMNVNLNKMESGNLSKVVAPNLLWKEGTDSIEYLVHSSKINDIVKLLIDEHKYFFPTSVDDFVQYATIEAKLFSHIKSVQCICVGSSTQIWSCDSIGAIKIWDIETFNKVKEIDSSQGRLFNMMRVGKYIWTLSGNNAKVWDPQNATCIKELAGFSYTAVQVDENTIWVGSENKIVVYNSEFSVVKNIDVPGNVVMTMCLEPSGKHVWAGTTDKRVNIHVFDAQTGQLHKELTGAHKRKINSFAVDTKSQIWSAGDDGAICIWDCEKYETVKRLEGQHQGAVYGVTALGNYMWSYGWDTIIRIWDLKTNEIVCKIEDQHSDCISSMCAIYSQHNNCWLGFTSSWDKSICGFAIGAIHHVPAPDNQVVLTSLSNEAVTPVVAVQPTASNSDYPLASEEDAKKDELAQRRKMIEERKIELEEKKKDLNRRRQELIQQSEQLEKDIAASQSNTPN